MSEAQSVQTTAPSAPRGRGHANRRGRAQRGRGGGHPRLNHGRGGHVPPSGGVSTSTIPETEPSEPEASGSRGGRGRRGGQRHGRGGAPTHASHIAPQRRFGGQLTSMASEPSEAGSMLSAAAPEFVPGQLAAQTRYDSPRSLI